MQKKQLIFTLLLGILLVTTSFLGGVYYANTREISSLTPSFFDTTKRDAKPLLQYTFAQLRSRTYATRTVSIEKELAKTDEFTSYLFVFDALGRKMTGQLNIPAQVTAQTPVIIMIRGFVPPEIFSTGVGTKNAAAVFAKNGYITIAPDFFGFGGSDPEPTDAWQARFEKPIIIIELLKTIREKGLPTALSTTHESTAELHKTQKVGIWGHSNGGQIAMSTLVTIQESVPTTLWAPVLAPFPYSIMYFSDESDDEGKGMRIWVSQLEENYTLKQFSFTQYLDGLLGPIQIQHGTNDEAAPHIWSEEFVSKLKKENQRREKIAAEIKSEQATTSAQITTPINYELITYPGADHNLQPATNWNVAVQKDLAFFNRQLLNN